MLNLTMAVKGAIRISDRTDFWPASMSASAFLSLLSLPFLPCRMPADAGAEMSGHITGPCPAKLRAASGSGVKKG